MFEGDKIESLMHPLDGVSVLHVADRKELGAEILAYAVSVCKAVDYGVHKLWEYNNVGKRYEDIPVLGQRQSEE